MSKNIGESLYRREIGLSGPYDFDEALKVAASNAPLINLFHVEGTSYDSTERIESGKSTLSQLGGMPDTTNILIEEVDNEPHVVSTTDPAAYPELLRQASAFQPSLGDIGIEEWIVAKIEHEMAHADSALHTSPQAKVDYGISLFRAQIPGTDREELVIQASIGITGSIRKIDYAMMLAAPKTLSASDLAQIQALGYDSPDQVLEIYSRLQMSLFGRIGLKLARIKNYRIKNRVPGASL